MTRNAAAIATTFVALLGLPPAQEPTPPPAVPAAPPRSQPSPDTATALHAAWLREVLDLDALGAANDYAAIQRRARANEPERWIAVARLAELQRIGLPVAAPLGLAEAPAPVRAAIDSMPPLPADELLPPLSYDPAELMRSIGTGRMPPLRPASAAVLEWVRSQLGGGLDGRLRQQIPFGTRSRPERDRARAERWYAADVALRELEGREQQAASLRRFYFSEWKPPVVEAEPGKVLARIQANIDGWLAEKDLGQQQLALLQKLREALGQRAAEDPAAAVQFLLRMPLYAERLTGPVRSSDGAAEPSREPIGPAGDGGAATSQQQPGSQRSDAPPAGTGSVPSPAGTQPR